MMPKGQRPAELRRFGLPQFAPVRPVVPDRPVLTVTGLVRHPTQVDLATALAGPHIERVADLHCVTTWSALGLDWSGVPFAAVHAMLAGRVHPHPKAAWVTFIGLDGYRSCVRLDDVLDDGLLADRLGGAALSEENGAPARLVIPTLYGYKSVKHLTGIEYRRTYDPGSAGVLAHRRGRVAFEERSALLPGWCWRPVWRRLQPRVRHRYDAPWRSS